MFDGFMNCYQIFRDHGVEDPMLETVRLFDLLSGGALRKMTPLFLESEGIDVAYIASKRKEGLPLEYIVGKTSFMGLELYCSPEALIPREETELLASVAIEYIQEMERVDAAQPSIIEIGVGSGNITVAMTMNSLRAHVHASDISPDAIKIAQKNTDKYGLQERISLLCGDVFSPFTGLGLEQRIDAVISNPPYIPTSSLSKLASEIIDHEPVVALDAGAYGIDIFRKLIIGSIDFLKPSGRLMFELGVGQEKLVARLLQRTGAYDDMQYFRNEEGVVRVISARRRIE